MKLPTPPTQGAEAHARGRRRQRLRIDACAACRGRAREQRRAGDVGDVRRRGRGSRPRASMRPGFSARRAEAHEFHGVPPGRDL